MSPVVMDVGQVLADYQLLREMGRGGSGIVFEAMDLRNGSRVAVKTLQADLTREEDQRLFARFVAEVQAVRRISHPNVVRILDAAKGSDGSGRALGFYAMELLQGGTLQQVVGTHGPLSVAQAVHVVAHAARGLHAAHAQDVVHRDVKPANIMFDETGRVVVVDFGVCRFAADQSLTATGDLVGSVRYISPEQAMNAEVDARADVFSLGAVLFYALTGEHLRQAPDVLTLVRAVLLNQDLARVEQSALPDPVKAVLYQALAVDPSQRIASAAALEEALYALAGHESVEPVAPLPLVMQPLTPVPTAVADPLLPVLVCPQCGAAFEHDTELQAHAAYCTQAVRVGRSVAEHEFLPPTLPSESLELAHEPQAASPTARCEYCGHMAANESELAAHLDGCQLRQWHDRNFMAGPPVNQQVQVLLDAPPVQEEMPAEGLAGLVDRVSRWFGKRTPPPTPTQDELLTMQMQVKQLQDADAVRLGSKGLELLMQVRDLVRPGSPLANIGAALLPNVTETAARLVQMCQALSMGRQFLLQFPPVQVERELLGLKQRNASADLVERKEALLKEARGMQTLLRQHLDRLQGVVDTLAHGVARLHAAMVTPTDEGNQQARAMMDGLVADLDAMGTTVAEMRKLGLH